MKRTLISILLLVAVLFTSACAGNQAAGQNAQSAQNVKTANSKKDAFASTYLSNIDKDAEMYIADFDFNQYLLDSGAISVERMPEWLDSNTVIAARYPNGIVTLYEFVGDRSNPSSYGYLSRIFVFVAEEGYNISARYNGEGSDDEFGVDSDWFHYFDLGGTTELTNDPKFEEAYDYAHSKFFTVKPNGIYYVVAKNGQKSLLVVPDYFDKGFKASILPYINMKDPSFRKDPMEGKLKGYSDLQ